MGRRVVVRIDARHVGCKAGLCLPLTPQVRVLICARQDADAATAEKPIEPPEMILSEDEDDYWGSFKGTASWQRKAAEDSVREETRTEAGAGGVLGARAKAVQKEYSWGGGSAPHSSLSMRHPPPGTSSGEECVLRVHGRVTESSLGRSKGVEVPLEVRYRCGGSVGCTWRVHSSVNAGAEQGCLICQASGRARW